MIVFLMTRLIVLFVVGFSVIPLENVSFICIVLITGSSVSPIRYSVLPREELSTRSVVRFPNHRSQFPVSRVHI